MEQLARFTRWFVSGIAFAIGIGAVMIAAEYVKAYFHESELVDSPTDLAVVSAEPLTINTYAGVSATLANKSTKVNYSPTGFELQISRGEKLLATCSPSGNRPQLNAQTTVTVQLTCPDILRASVPSDAIYKLTIETAWRFKREQVAAAVPSAPAKR
jgi:histidyl-tRNA synthetase